MIDILQMMQQDPDTDHPRNLMCYAELRKKEKCWNQVDLSNVITGTVCGTFGVQLSSWLLSTQMQHANYASRKQGKSGFYKCVNLHLHPHPLEEKLSSAQAQSRVVELVDRFNENGFAKSVNMAWVDQNYCSWFRQFGRDNGTDGRKNDVILYSKTDHTIFLPYRHTDIQLQVFILDRWHKVTDFWEENHKERKGSDIISLTRLWTTREKRKAMTLIQFHRVTLNVSLQMKEKTLF